MGRATDHAAALDAARIAARLDALWEIARGPEGGADRPAYSAAEAAAMRLVAGWATDAGLRPALDRHGNLWALPDGDGPLVSSGSHVDTVPDGGRYDGALGTVLALEAASALRDVRPVAVLVCAAEEAPRFGAGTLGSRQLTGALDDVELADRRDASGTSVPQARAAFLDALADLPRLERAPVERLRAHAEVHVEPRHDLRARGARLGVVERIAGPHRHRISIEGEAGHAGEVAMTARRDALAAAAEVVLAVERAGRTAAERWPATVTTVGSLDVRPGSISVIPARVVAAVDIRAVDPAATAAVEDALDAALAEVAERRGVRVTRERLRADDPIALDPRLAALAVDAAGRRGVRAARTHSGSGHDAGHLGALVPAALLFVPLAGGQGHTPQEHADEADVLAGGRVLVDLLAAA